MGQLARTLLLAAVWLVATGCGVGGSTPGGGATAPSALAGGTWVLTEGSVDGRAVTVPDDTRISLTVDGDQAGGTAACNRYGATIDLDGPRVAFSGMSATEMACDPAAMEAQRLFLEGLGRVDTATRRTDRLQLTGPDVSLAFQRNRAVPAEELVGTTWQLDTLIDADTARTADAEATLRLRADGTLAGSTGCRELTGDYQLSGDHVSFTNLGRHGECPPALDEQDDHVWFVLEGGFRAEVDGNRLTITSLRGDRGLGYTAR